MERRPLEKLLDMSSIEVPGELLALISVVLYNQLQILRRRLVLEKRETLD